MAVHGLTEAIIEGALADRSEPLTNADVERMSKLAGVSPATFYRSEAVIAFRARLAGPPKRATKGTKETMSKLRSSVKLLANCVQVLSLKIAEQEEELAHLRERTYSNVTTLRPRQRG